MACIIEMLNENLSYRKMLIKEMNSYFLYEQCRKEVKFIPIRVGCIFRGNEWLQFEARAKRVL